MKTTIIKALITSAIIGYIVLFASCSSKKNASKQRYDYQQEQSETTKDPLGNIIPSLANSYKPWTDVSMPVKLELKEPKRFSVSGKASMVYGKSIYISLRILGMELGYVYVDTDSIYIVSKMQHMAYAESLGYFSRNFGFSLEDIQSLLLGRAFVPGKGSLTLSTRRDFKIHKGEKSNEWVLTPINTARNVSWHFEGCNPVEDTIAAIVNALIVTPSSAAPLTARFFDQYETEAGVMASEIDMSAQMSNRALKLNVIWNPRRAEWNKGIAPATPKIPSDYTRLSTKGLVELLKKL